MPAGKLDLTIEQGATFRHVLYWTDAADQPVNITGYTARMHIREHVTSTTALLQLTTENGRITLVGAEGKITLFLTAVDSAAITWSRGVYDLELVNGSEVTRLVQGKVFISKEVTR